MLRLNRGTKIGLAIVTLVVLAVVVLTVLILAQVWTEVLWFRQLGFTSVLLTEWGTRIALFVLGFAVMMFLDVALG